MTVVDVVEADERLAALVSAHRAEQAAYRIALAAENPAQAAACTKRLGRIAQAVRADGRADVATALAEETSAGAVLLTLLTAADEVSRDQLPAALARFQTGTDTVDTCLDRAGRGESADAFNQRFAPLRGGTSSSASRADLTRTAR